MMTSFTAEANANYLDLNHMIQIRRQVKLCTALSLSLQREVIIDACIHGVLTTLYGHVQHHQHGSIYMYICIGINFNFLNFSMNFFIYVKYEEIMVCCTPL